MRTTSAVGRRTLAAIAAATIAVTLTGCGAADGDVVSSTGGGTASTPATTPADPADGPGADEPSAAATRNASPVPTLPPGDPGPDAPGTDDPNGDLASSGAPSHRVKDARTSVPPTAVLDAETVASVAGGSWTTGVAPVDSCTAPRPAKAVATRSTQLSGDGENGAAGSQVVETVATHHGKDAAVRAVDALATRLTGCHATSAPDPRIGDASVQLTLTATDGSITVVTAAAVEGVTFVLTGTGPVMGRARWSALTDIALGSTCVAAMDGCH